MPVNIFGKSYKTVAERVLEAHSDKSLEGVNTEVITHIPVVIKATIIIKGKTYTGISSVDLTTNKAIEKNNPYEVAETSAVGRALAFAGYGGVDTLASADEMIKAGATQQESTPTPDADEPMSTLSKKECLAHTGEMMERKYSNAKSKWYWVHQNAEGKRCFGDGLWR